MAWTTDTSYGALKRVCRFDPHLRAVKVSHVTADDAVRATTAFSSLADMLATEASYSPKFCVSRAESPGEQHRMLRAGRAFNFAAEHAGQARRAIFF